MDRKHVEALRTVLYILEILERIPHQDGVTAKELHEELANTGYTRDIRTLQKHLQELSRIFPLDIDDRCKPYRYRWSSGAKSLSIPNLSPSDALVLRLAEEHLANLLPAQIMQSMQRFFKQAHNQLNISINTKLEREWSEKIRVVATSQPLLPPKIEEEIFATVSEALYLNRWLQLVYKNATGNSQDIEVMPLGLAQQGNRLYLVCRYRGYTAERSLALHRIMHAHMTHMSFDRPVDFDLKKFDEDGQFGFGHGQQIRLRFEIRKRAGLHLYETRLSADQSITDLHTGWLSVTATVVDSAMLDWWLRSFGTGVRKILKFRNWQPH